MLSTQNNISTSLEEQVSNHVPEKTDASTTGSLSVLKKKEENLNITWKEEIAHLLNLAAPSMLVSLISMSYRSFTVIFVGQYLGTNELAGIALGTLITNVTGVIVAIGALSSMETIVGHAYGCKHYSLYSLATQRGFIVMLALWIGVAILWNYMTPILIAMHQPREASIKAGIFCKIYIVLFPIIALTEIQKRFLNGQNIVQCQVVLSIIFLCIFHPILCYIVIPTYGYKAAVWCNVISSVLYTTSLICYTSIFKPHIPQTFEHIKMITKNNNNNNNYKKADMIAMTSPKSIEEDDDDNDNDNNDDNNDDEEKEINNDNEKKESKTIQSLDESMEKSFVLERYPGMKGYLILTLAGIGTQCFEWWGFEVNTLLIGLLGNDALAAQGLYGVVLESVYMIPLGASIALTTRLGHLIGGQQYKLAKRAAIYGWCTPFVTTIWLSLTIIIAKKWVPRLFTSDPKVLVITESLAPFVASFMMLDAIQGIGNGILRGLSLQTKAVYVVTISIWFIGLPMSIIFGFVLNQGITGVYAGVITGYTLMCLALFIIKDFFIIIAFFKIQNSLCNPLYYFFIKIINQIHFFLQAIYNKNKKKLYTIIPLK
ncbi:hypothetical protein RFI_07729 [Reticulomyxa filosa]|uniref:Uncharacterized protein n=1 Tax=Reticulomyxa filosa TaxID=46433 RepID=X6NTU7_RETFI|nr:hypothetical protein RFI_07729 [Reticulomyxa filosa]|eukprot:ETO29386.1 hypothetical protein RFI_07729 [Reticulomyxa filosa]